MSELGNYADRIDELEKEVAALRADAERWRYVRDALLDIVPHPLATDDAPAWSMSEVVYGKDEESAIDNARGKK